MNIFISLNVIQIYKLILFCIYYQASEKTSYFQKEKDEIVMKQGRLADRLEKLESATEGWRKRVTTADAVQFSVAGKMRVDKIDKNIYDKAIFDISMGNCVSERKKKVPKTKEINKKGKSIEIYI